MFINFRQCIINFRQCITNFRLGCSYENSLLAKIFIEPVTIFCERPGTKFCPQSFSTPCRTTKLGVYKMVDAVHGKRTC